MKILSIGTAFPSWQRSNQDLLDEVRQINGQVAPQLLEQYLRILSVLLKRAGANTRYWRDTQAGETSYQLLQQAMQRAFAQSSVTPADIDMVIYCGVGRGFLEPANAYFCAKMMGINCVCFDISDACMSYVRALEIAQNYLMTGQYHNILIVNCECTVHEYGYPDLFRVQSVEQLQYTFPAFTIGEAATATIVNAEGEPWQFHFDSEPSLANLCTIPLLGYKDFVAPDDDVGQCGVNRFVSMSSDLFRVAVERIVSLAERTIDDVHEPDIWFPHTASSEPCVQIAKILGIPFDDVYIDSFYRYGNLASASIPAAIQSALTDNKLQRGMKVVLAPGSAGMSFAIVKFVF